MTLRAEPFGFAQDKLRECTLAPARSAGESSADEAYSCLASAPRLRANEHGIPLCAEEEK